MFTKNDMKNQAKDAIITALKDGYTGYLCDLHNEVFNMEYYNDDAETSIDILNNVGGYMVVFECLKYEKDNFGEMNIDINRYSNPVKTLSMYWYIIGEEALSELMNGVSLADELWNEEMTEEEAKTLAELFEAKVGYDTLTN